MLFSIVFEKILSIVETVIFENFIKIAFIFYSVISIFYHEISSRIARNQAFSIGVTLCFFFKNEQKTAFSDRVNPMNFLQNLPKISYFELG